MDPRKAATVTDPELLKAFREDTEGVGEGTEEETPLKVFLTLFDREDDDPETTEFELHQLDHVLELLRDHLRKGGSRGGAIVIDTFQPELVSEFIE